MKYGMGGRDAPCMNDPIRQSKYPFNRHRLNQVISSVHMRGITYSVIAHQILVVQSRSPRQRDHFPPRRICMVSPLLPHWARSCAQREIVDIAHGLCSKPQIPRRCFLPRNNTPGSCADRQMQTICLFSWSLSNTAGNPMFETARCSVPCNLPCGIQRGKYFHWAKGVPSRGACQPWTLFFL